MKTLRGKGIVVWTIVTCSSGAVGAVVVAPSTAHAQLRVGVSVDWWDWIGDVRVHGRVDYGDRRLIYRDHGHVYPPVGEVRRHPPRVPPRVPAPVRPRIREERGPPFCRSGEGHPVHGWDWCLRKGFARSHRSYRRSGVLRRDGVARRPAACCVWRRWDRGGVHFHDGGRYGVGRKLGEHEVLHILGRVVVDDLYATVGYRRDAPLQGRWHPSTGEAQVLQVRVGRTPLAEFTDFDGDRRVDRALVARVKAPMR